MGGRSCVAAGHRGRIKSLHSGKIQKEKNPTSQKIYKLCLIRGYTEAYYQLSAAEKQKLWADVSQAIDGAGAKMVTPYYECRWSNDRYKTFFTIEYPHIEAAMTDTAGVEKAELFRYLTSETILGIEVKEEEAIP